VGRRTIDFNQRAEDYGAHKLGRGPPSKMRIQRTGMILRSAARRRYRRRLDGQAFRPPGLDVDIDGAILVG